MNNTPDNSEPLRSSGWFGQWSPIESAPKRKEVTQSRERMLLLCRTGKVVIGYYDEDSYAKKPRPFWRHEGAFYVTSEREDQPTHWMPLPPPLNNRGEPTAPRTPSET